MANLSITQQRGVAFRPAIANWHQAFGGGKAPLLQIVADFDKMFDALLISLLATFCIWSNPIQV